MLKKLCLCILAPFLIAGCSNKTNLHSTNEQEMTLGIVQKEIHQGMSQGDVATALGSPNIVTKDESGTQTWIYDKIASEVSYSNKGVGVWFLIGAYEKDSGARASSQKTL